MDSGSDATTIALEVADEMEIKYDRRSHYARGANGRFREYEATGNVLLHTTVGDVLLRKPSINPKLDDPIVLLGRQDFFRAFKVCFDEREKVMTVTRHERRRPRVTRAQARPRARGRRR